MPVTDLGQERCEAILVDGLGALGATRQAVVEPRRHRLGHRVGARGPWRAAKLPAQLGMASSTAVFVEPVTLRRIRFPSAANPRLAEPRQRAMQCRWNSGSVHSWPFRCSKDGPAYCWHARNPHLGLHRWDHFETTVDLLEDPHVL